MANENKNKKPLVTLDAANPAPDGVVKTEPMGSGWAGDVKPQGDGPQLQDNTPTINEHQLRNVQSAPSGVSAKDINKAPGSGEVELPASATKYGVLRGAPASVVLQHMIDAIPAESEEQRKRREKAEKRNALFAAIGDGVSALSNLYFTTKGSPSADQSKSLSKAESDRKDKARKERESNIEKRLRLLKEQRAELNNIESQRLKDRQLEIMEKYREGQNKISRKRADDYMEYLTKKNQLEKEDKEAEAKRKAELDKQEQQRKDALNKSAVDRNNAAKAKYFSDARVNQQKGNAYVRDANDRMAKRGRNQRQYNPANDPGMEKVVERDRKTGTTTTYYRPRPKPSKPAGKTGSGSAKSKFSIHK